MKKIKVKEREFQKAVVELAENCGWLVYHVSNVKGSLRNSTAVGFPDLVLVHPQNSYPSDGNPRILFWECKIPPNKPTENQNAWLEAIEQAGEYIYDDRENPVCRYTVAESAIITPDTWLYIENRLKLHLVNGGI